MKKILNLLLIDDHPITIDGYKNILETLHATKEIYDYNTDESYCCETAFKLIENKTYDLVLLDISLPPSKDGMFKSGEDLGQFILKRHPKTKILVITSFNDPILLNNILHFISPKGFLYKGDINVRLLSEAIINVLNGNTYYSTLILNLIQKNLSSRIFLDVMDKQILYQLSKGVKTVDLKKTIPLSQAGIEKRKRILKDTFNTKSLDDSALIRAVIEKGYL
ncbi:response regulator transcription factor [Bizionia argentinensis JUB59]|uniref:Response regulator transcription factor n=1 Tax=Bizionia argentinensis JUB59 TaxID=1046627 RepID=G2EGY8_9FLAO|nr:response regulator [Bizionia argentinensis]EGV42300.1 response regulator transcription factor [Bizionia argentinensis JUB59]